VLEKLRNRYNEFFAAMKNLLFKLQQNYSLASADVKVRPQTGLRVLGFRVKGLGFRVLGFRVSGVRVLGF
jgi:hypothetical protein